ncbi:MAG: SAM-dependent methyltransferase [Gammaproteobacteria bacterium]|nr:MAG: SAM-dependent methyltransferase [Gammaproteobacteria bacterium]
MINTVDVNTTDVNKADYWQQRYEAGKIGWDMGRVSPPIKAYIDTAMKDVDKTAKILIAGAGNAYEAEYLHEQGFVNVIVVDFAQAPLENLAKKFPDFPKGHLLQSDFFKIDSEEYQFDYSIEQTFFCAIDIARRAEYVKKMYELLKPAGKLVGLLWDKDFGRNEPPFGGSRAEYETLFADKFITNIMAPCHNSHPKRQGNELFVEFVSKKSAVNKA